MCVVLHCCSNVEPIYTEIQLEARFDSGVEGDKEWEEPMNWKKC